MKERYFVLVENFCDCHEIGEFNDLAEANKFMQEQGDHYNHGEISITVSESSLKTLIHRAITTVEDIL